MLSQKENKRAQRSAPQTKVGGVLVLKEDTADYKDMLVRARELSCILQERVQTDVLAHDMVKKCFLSPDSSKSTVSLLVCVCESVFGFFGV